MHDTHAKSKNMLTLPSFPAKSMSSLPPSIRRSGLAVSAKQYRRMLRAKSIRQSMSRTRNCLGNAVMESIFGLPKRERLRLQVFDSLDHFKNELMEYLDYYNNRRLKANVRA
jgi:transposase InsO family protein